MSYQENQNKLLLNYLDRYEKNSVSLELIISSECDQKCEYCYLFKHGHKMYSKESNDKNNILKNLPIVLEYFYKNFPLITNYEIFSGEFFNLSYWEDVLTIILNFLKEKQLTQFTIGIPTNMSFLWDLEKTQKIEAWIKDILDSENHIYLSASVDGPSDLEELERASKDNKKKNDIFYDRLFSFLAKYKYNAHPMITKNFVKNYKTNYDFWLDNSLKYQTKFTKEDGNTVVGIPMFLEVRDPDQWDDESIENYKKFLWYVAEKDLETIHQNNEQELIYHIVDDFSTSMQSLGEYCSCQPYIIAFPQPNMKIPCSIQGGPAVRVGDLALVPCHRTCYPNLIYGHFISDGEQIIGIKGNNPLLAYKIKTFNPNRSMLKCTSCPINVFCPKGCLGSQLEHNKELFSAQDAVCSMYFAKYKTIHEIALHYNIYEKIKNDVRIPYYRREFIQYVRTILERL